MLHVLTGYDKANAPAWIPPAGLHHAQLSALMRVEVSRIRLLRLRHLNLRLSVRLFMHAAVKCQSITNWFD